MDIATPSFYKKIEQGMLFNGKTKALIWSENTKKQHFSPILCKSQTLFKKSFSQPILCSFFYYQTFSSFSASMLVNFNFGYFWGPLYCKHHKTSYQLSKLFLNFRKKKLSVTTVPHLMSTYFVFLFAVFIFRRVVRIEHVRETFSQRFVSSTVNMEVLLSHLQLIADVKPILNI